MKNESKSPKFDSLNWTPKISIKQLSNDKGYFFGIMHKSVKLDDGYKIVSTAIKDNMKYVLIEHPIFDGVKIRDTKTIDEYEGKTKKAKIEKPKKAKSVKKIKKRVKKVKKVVLKKKVKKVKKVVPKKKVKKVKKVVPKKKVKK